MITTFFALIALVCSFMLWRTVKKDSDRVRKMWSDHNAKKGIKMALICLTLVFTTTAGAAETRSAAIVSYTADYIQTITGKATISKAAEAKLKVNIVGFANAFLDKLDEPARKEWIAFQGTEACRELNEFVSKKGLTDPEGLLERVNKHTPLSYKAVSESQELQKLYNDMQIRALNIILSDADKH